MRYLVAVAGFLHMSLVRAATPEEAVGSYIEGIRNGGLAAIAGLTHPEEQAKFQAMGSPIVTAALQDESGRRVFGRFCDATGQSRINEFTPEEFMAAFLASIDAIQPNLSQALKTAKVEVLGHVKENDVSHVVVRMRLSMNGAETEKVNVISTRDFQGEPRLMLSGEIKQAAEAYEAMRRSKQPAPGKVIKARTVPSQFVNWVKKGSLSQPGRFEDGLEYHAADGEIFKVSQDTANVGRMVRAEIDDEAQMKTFVQTKLTSALVMFFGRQYIYPVNESYLSRRRVLPASQWPQDLEPGALEKSTEILKKYLCDGRPLIEGGRWQLELFLTDPTGCIERWGINGDLYPFSIAKLEKTVVEQPGAIVPVPRRPASTPPKPEARTPTP